MRNILIVITVVLFSQATFAKCFVVDGANKSEFNGQSLAGLQVEKKSLTALDTAFPNLKAKEKMFSGELMVCSDCTAKHIKCE